MYDYRDDDCVVCPMCSCCCPFMMRQPNGVPTPPQMPPFPGGGPMFPGQMPPFPGQAAPFPGQAPGFPGQQGPGFGPPGPPPAQAPAKKASITATGAPVIQAIDPGAIRPCLYQFVYIWLENGRSFWAWLVYVGRRSAAGWRWNGRRWVYFGVDLDDIDEFFCLGR